MNAAIDIIGNLMPLWGWGLYALFSAGLLYFYRRQHKPMLHGLTLIYLAFILILTIFSRTPKDYQTAAWLPFWSWYEVLVHHKQRLFEEIVLNFLMLLPLGAMLAWQSRRFEVKHAVRIGLALSASIEFTQLVFHLGLFEWDDMLHNTLGCAVGAWIVGKIRKQ